MTIQRKVLWGGLGALGGLCLLLAVILVSFDGELLKQHLIEQVRQQKNRELRIQGPLELEFFPRLGLELSDLSLSGYRNDKEFLSLGGLKGSVDVFSLLRGRLLINRIELRELHLNLERYGDGRTNYEDLLSPPDQEASALQLELERLTLLGGNITWKDGMTGQQFALSDVFLKTGALGPQSQGRLEMGGRVSGLEPTVKLSVQLDTLYRLDVPAGVIQFDNLQGWGRGDGQGLNSARVDLNGRRVKLDTRQMVLEVEALLLMGAGSWREEGLTLKLEVPSLQVNAKGSEGKKIQATLALEGPTRQMGGQLTLEGLDVSRGRLAVQSLRVDTNFRQADLQLTGQFASPLAYSFSSRQLDLSNVQGELEGYQPSRLLKPVKAQLLGKMSLDLAGKKAAGELELALDESRLTGDWRLERLSPPLVEFSASLNQLDLDRYLKVVTDITEPAKEAAPGAPEPDEDERSAGLSLQGRIKVGQLKFRQLKMENLEARLRLERGRLELNPLGARLYEGRLTGMVSLGPRPGELELRQQLRNVSFRPLLQDWMDMGFLAGQGDLRLALKIAAGNGHDARRGLSGTGSVRLQNGALLGVDLPEALQRGRGGAQLENVDLSGSPLSRTSFTEMRANFRIQDGYLRTEDLQMKSPVLRLNGRGEVDLQRALLDYRVQATPVGAARSRARLGAQSFPLWIKGNFAKPRYELDWAALAQTGGRSGNQERPLSGREPGDGSSGVLRGLFR